MFRLRSICIGGKVDAAKTVGGAKEYQQHGYPSPDLQEFIRAETSFFGNLLPVLLISSKDLYPSAFEIAPPSTIASKSHKVP